MDELDSEFFSEAVADAKTIRQTAIENAKDHLEEAFTPKLQSMLSQTIQQEMEGEEEMPDEEEGGDEEEEIELDLSDLEDAAEEAEEEEEGEEEASDEEESEEDMEEITDQDELDLDSVMEFLEAASMDDRHSDEDTADDLSDDNVTYDDEMLDTGEYEDGNTQSNQSAIMDDVDKIAQELEEETELQEELEDEVVEAFLDVLDEEEHEEEGDYMEDEEEEHMEETVFDVDLNEFGVTGTDREAMDGLADVSGPYDTETDPNIGAEAGEGVDVGGEPYDPEAPGIGTDEDSGTEDLDQPIDTDNLYEEEVEYDLSALLEDETTVDSSINEAAELREQNQELKEELSKHRQAIKILREKINETNLINSKLLYTNRLFKEFGLNDRQKMKVIESFDRASNTREAKLIYTTLAENFNKNQSGSSEQVNENRKSNKKDMLVEAINGGLSSEKTGGTSTPSDDQKQILNENSDLKNRFQKLANLK